MAASGRLRRSVCCCVVVQGRKTWYHIPKVNNFNQTYAKPSYSLHHPPCFAVARRLFLAEQATNNRDVAHAALLLVTFLVLASAEHVADGSETKATEQLVDSETAEQTVDEAAETETVEETTDQVQDAGQ
jgi:hypothetical protein